MPPISFLWPIFWKVAPKLWKLLVEGKPLETITLFELLDEHDKNNLMIEAARERAKKRIADGGSK